MVRVLTILIVFLTNFSGVFQAQDEKEYIVLVVDVKRSNKLHPKDTYYWIAESDKLDTDGNFAFSPLFLELFYTSNSYDECCTGEPSRFYTFTTESKVEFTKEFSEKQEKLRNFLEKNKRKIQTIDKKWEVGLKEDVTIYAVPIKANLCSCKVLEDKQFESVFLPKSNFKLNSEFWQTEISKNITMDYSLLDLEYSD